MNKNSIKTRINNVENVVELEGIQSFPVPVDTDEIECMSAEELWNALISDHLLVYSRVYQEEIIPQIDKVLKLHPLATMSEIAEVFIDDVLELVDDIPSVMVEVLVVEDYISTDRGFYDDSYILGYRIASEKFTPIHVFTDDEDDAMSFEEAEKLGAVCVGRVEDAEPQFSKIKEVFEALFKIVDIKSTEWYKKYLEDFEKSKVEDENIFYYVLLDHIDDLELLSSNFDVIIEKVVEDASFDYEYWGFKGTEVCYNIVGYNIKLEEVDE